MTTKLEKVLAEPWSHDVTHVDAGNVGEKSTAQFGHYEERQGGDCEFVSGGHDSIDETRAGVAALGHDALAMVLRLEAIGPTRCPDCDALVAAMHPHTSDCAWVRIVEEARKLG